MSSPPAGTLQYIGSGPHLPAPPGGGAEDPPRLAVGPTSPRLLSGPCLPPGALSGREELGRYAAHLYEDVAKLEEERARLEGELNEARAQQHRLDGELEMLRRRCAELERLAHQGRAAGASAGENADLRKQLAAYAVEIDVLREEKERTAKELQRRALTWSPGVADGDVTLALTVRNVNFELLHAKPELLEAFSNRIRQAIADDAISCGEAGLIAEHATIEQCSRGSVTVRATVTPPFGGSAGELHTRMNSSLTLAKGVATSLEGLSGMEAVREGPIGVHSIVVQHRSRQDYRQLHEAYQGLVRAHDALQQAHHGVLLSHDQTRAEHRALQEQHESECGLREEAEWRLKASMDDTDARLQFETDRRSEDQRRLEATDALKEEFGRIVDELMGLVHELQDKYVAQTRHYEQLASRVRKMQLSQVQDVQDAEEVAAAQMQFLESLRSTLGRARRGSSGRDLELERWRAEHEKLDSKVNQLYDENRSAANHLRFHKDQVKNRDEQEAERIDQERQRKESRQGRHRILNDGAIHKAMAQALEGKMVQKVCRVDAKSLSGAFTGTLEWRLLKVIVEPSQRAGEAPSLWVRWAKEPYQNFTDKTKGVDLSRVVAIGYGYAARAPRLLEDGKRALPKDIQPERCFSVFTPRRSFDFICTEDEHCEMFMLVLSRLCYRNQGWPVLGNIPTHSKFEAAKGWCKVQKKCREKNETLHAGARGCSAVAPPSPVKGRARASQQAAG